MPTFEEIINKSIKRKKEILKKKGRREGLI